MGVFYFGLGVFVIYVNESYVSEIAPALDDWSVVDHFLQNNMVVSA